MTKIFKLLLLSITLCACDNTSEECSKHSATEFYISWRKTEYNANKERAFFQRGKVPVLSYENIKNDVVKSVEKIGKTKNGENLCKALFVNVRYESDKEAFDKLDTETKKLVGAPQQYSTLCYTYDRATETYRIQVYDGGVVGDNVSACCIPKLVLRGKFSNLADIDATTCWF
ncbi:MAG: hypothetical protein IKS08_01880 [Alphaproteobacteria bacterium]|nr:hypothetical protein [Alphaproteobacteria bacterium]